MVFFLLPRSLFTACEDTESVTFDPNSGQTGIGFADSEVDFTVPVDGVTISVPVFSTTISAQDRTFNVTANADASNVAASEYSLGSVLIPANSHEGNLDVTFNYDGLEDFFAYELVVDVEPTGGATVFAPLTYTFLREFDINEFVCTSDYQLIINFDNFGSENTWELTDGTGAILYSGGPYDDGGTGTSASCAHVTRTPDQGPASCGRQPSYRHTSRCHTTGGLGKDT